MPAGRLASRLSFERTTVPSLADRRSPSRNTGFCTSGGVPSVENRMSVWVAARSSPSSSGLSNERRGAGGLQPRQQLALVARLPTISTPSSPRSKLRGSPNLASSAAFGTMTPGREQQVASGELGVHRVELGRECGDHRAAGVRVAKLDVAPARRGRGRSARCRSAGAGPRCGRKGARQRQRCRRSTGRRPRPPGRQADLGGWRRTPLRSKTRCPRRRRGREVGLWRSGSWSKPSKRPWPLGSPGVRKPARENCA